MKGEMRMRDRQPSDRPREKLARDGAARLSDLELLMAIIGSGNARADVGKIARCVLKALRTRGGDLTHEELSKITGLGAAKVTVILANFELARRYLLKSDQPIIDEPSKAAEQLTDIRDKRQEHFVCLTLDGAHRLIAKRTITIGTLTASLVHPREVFTDAIADRAAGVIVAGSLLQARLTERQRSVWPRRVSCLASSCSTTLSLRNTTTYRSSPKHKE